MTRPPFINQPQPPEEIFLDRRAKKQNDAQPPGSERRSKQQFDAIPWWLKVNYTKATDPARQVNEEPVKQAKK